MRVGPYYILALYSAFAALAARSEEALPQASDWEGPLVEVTRSDTGSSKQKGYLMSYQSGRMLFRPLDKCSSDEELSANEIVGIKFLAPPPKPPAPPHVEATSTENKATETKSESKLEQKLEAIGPERPFAGMRLREKLEKARDFFEPPNVEKLTVRERDRYRELTIRHPGKHSLEELKELNALRAKMDLPTLETYRFARSEAFKAKTDEQMDAFLNEKRRDLAASKSSDDARKTLIAIMYALKAQEDSPESYLSSLQKTLTEETARINDTDVRNAVRGSLRELITDFVTQNLRYEKDREDRMLLRPGMRKTE